MHDEIQDIAELEHPDAGDTQRFGRLMRGHDCLLEQRDALHSKVLGHIEPGMLESGNGARGPELMSIELAGVLRNAQRVELVVRMRSWRAPTSHDRSSASVMGS